MKKVLECARWRGRGGGGGGQGQARCAPIQRKIDTSVDPNSLEANSIEGSSSSSSSSSSSTQDDWLTGALKFFGYENFGQFVKEIDIFTLPTRIQKAMKTYRDELSMGQCYMEFTTYTLFSKPDNFFTNFMRNKRSLPEEEELWEARVIGGSGGGGGDGGGGSAFERLAQGFISMLDSSPTTRQYASLLKQVLPVVVQMTAAQDSGSAVTTFVKHALGSYLSDIQSPTKTTNGIEKIDKPTDKWPSSSSSSSSSSPPSSSSSSSSSSPLSDIILGGFKYYMSNYLSSLPAPPPPKTRPPTPKPEEKEESKNFIEMILEFIRPVFISIIGKSPGESGVESIREVTRLSRLGRVDDILAEEVLSPYFCLKNYMVNKIWTLTERG
ncbi:uncharacterized protein LOC135096252 [Scylla paramamosain]|uniref:uncharacterized protein LOC135096252 n=1 Tax=Scylla paramamosain TaxID=85552 RepID=UPI003082E96E